jgi:hypothetical protein
MSFYYITSVENVSSIMRSGILSREMLAQKPKIKFKDPSEKNCQIKRAEKNLHYYVPLFLNPRNAMLYRYLKESRKVVILEIDEEVVKTEGTLISFRNASSKYAKIMNYTKENYDNLDFQKIFRKSWYNNYKIKLAMQSEILIPKKVSANYIKTIYTFPGSIKKYLEEKTNIKNEMIKNQNEAPLDDLMFGSIFYNEYADIKDIILNSASKVLHSFHERIFG